MKLAVAGLKEDDIAALDGDWAEFTPAQRAAFTLARKLTYEPYRITDADMDELRRHFTELQILEMVLSVAGNNALNRWKEGVGVPQSKDLSGFLRKTENASAVDGLLPTRSFLTPTAEKYQHAVSKVAVLSVPEQGDGAPYRGPLLEDRADVEKSLALARTRTPRLPLVAEGRARELLSKDWPQGPLPQWVRLLANFPKDGKSRILSLRAAEEKGDLRPLLKAEVSWIIARQDRAGYALGEAKQRLEQLGRSAEQSRELDGDWACFTPAERALFTVARKLAASPIVLTDEDVAQAVKLAGPREVVQLISYTTNRTSFARITEAAGLQVGK
jgi:alkylhydroperoxidase family enzyme